MAKVVQGVAKDDVRRSLHWVFKIGSLGRAIRFYNDVFHMRVLRSEEFAEGCAVCLSAFSNVCMYIGKLFYNSESVL